MRVTVEGFKQILFRSNEYNQTIFKERGKTYEEDTNYTAKLFIKHELIFICSTWTGKHTFLERY